MTHKRPRNFKGNKVLRELRAHLGLTQVEFGKKVQLSPIYITQLETGTYGIGVDGGLKILGRYRHILEQLGRYVPRVLAEKGPAQQTVSGHPYNWTRMSAKGGERPIRHPTTNGRSYRTASGGPRPRLCQKSGVMLPVGKKLAKPPLFEAQSHSSARFTVESKGKLKSFPTVSL